MLKRVLFRAAAVAAALVFSGSAQADFIDTFALPSPAVTGSVVTPGTSLVNTQAVTANLTRTTTIGQLAVGSFGTQYGIGVGSTFTGFVLATSTNAQAYGLLNYTYTTPEDLSSSGTSLQFSFSNNIAGIPLSVTITDAASNSSTQTGVGSGTGVFAFSTGSFSGVSLANVKSIILNLNRDASIGDSSVTLDSDFQLTDVRLTTPTPPAVPAPPAAVLVLAALPVLGLARARRNLPV